MATKKAPKAKPEVEEKQAKVVKAAIEKHNVVLDNLAVEYLPVDSVRPNQYNPNRQSAHDFELLCKSIAEDGFTQPIVVQKDTREIVDGEHRWRACKALGFTEVPCVLTEMTPEQQRIATLRHNRARGSEDAAMASDVLRELRDLGALDHARESLQLDDVEVERLLNEMPKAEAATMTFEVPIEQLGPNGHGLSALDKTHNIDTKADETRAREKMLAVAMVKEERRMEVADADVYRLMVFFDGDEGDIVKSVLGTNQAVILLELCRAADSQAVADL